MSTAPLDLSAPVADALAEGRPVVALESTIIAHGLPRPQNHEAAREFEAQLESTGVVPATVAVLDGRLCVGLDESQLERVAHEDIAKLGVRDLPVVVARRGSGATTVAATSFAAALAGVRVFATGGLGGVHREAATTFDESADLPTLAETPITVVSAGAKSILDVGATLERLETLGVTVLGYRTHAFPGFWITDSGHELDWSVDDPEAVADVMAAQDALGRRSAVLLANPLPAERQLDPGTHAAALAEALAAAAARGVGGKDVSPFLLDAMVRITGGESLRVNLDIARNNVRVAGEVATAWSRRGSGGAS